MNKQILIIDDEPISIRIIKNYIGDKYKLNAVTDGSAAIKYLSKYKPDVILLDYMMPIYDGVHLMEILKKNAATADIPVIVVSGLADEERLETMRELGAYDIVKKPIDKDVLISSIEKIIG